MFYNLSTLIFEFYDLLEKIAISVGAILVFILGILYIADHKKPPNQ